MEMLPVNVKKAINFAAQAHGEQKRKIGNIPYIVHPTEVAMILLGFDYGEQVAMAGALHDVLEDTKITKAELVKFCGTEVTEMVELVTEKKGEDWLTRKKNSIVHVKDANWQVLALKAADAISNMTDMVSWYKSLNNDLFKGFKQGKSDTILRYQVLTDAILERREAYSIYSMFKDRRKDIYDELEITAKGLLSLF